MKVARARVTHTRPNGPTNEVKQTNVNSTNWKSTPSFNLQCHFPENDLTKIKLLFSSLSLNFQRIQFVEANFSMLFIEWRFLWTQYDFVWICFVAIYPVVSELDVHTESGQRCSHRKLYCIVSINSLRNDLGHAIIHIEQNCQ